MDVVTLMINQILLLLLFISPVIIHSKHSCPNSTCSNSFFPINYPFKLQDWPPMNCYNFINLRCDDRGRAIINLPYLGDFHVTSIDYALQRVYLTDPGDCLLGRLMVTNLSVYPLDAFFYDNYTYYTCPRVRIRHPFVEIRCLSNSTHSTIATTGLPSEFMEETYGCKTIVSTMIPALRSSEYNYSGNFVDLQLTWNVSGCRECEGHGPHHSGESKSEMTKFVGYPIAIACAVLLSVLLGIASLLRIMKLTPGMELSAAEAPPGTSNGTLLTQNSQVESFSQVLVWSEGQGTLMSCSICLEEYDAKDRVRSLPRCGHFFHVQCIDEWLLTKTSCPVCRTSLPSLTL